MALLNDFQILQNSGGGGAAYRREDRLMTDVIRPKQSTRLTLSMGKAITLLKLDVSEPCRVSIHGTSEFSDLNPFEFVAYQNYLSFDGAVVDTLGTVWGNNRHPTLANKDKYPNGNLYIEVSNYSDLPINPTIDLTWLVLED